MAERILGEVRALDVVGGDAADPSSAHVLGRLAAVELAVERAVARRRGDDPDPDDRLRGLLLRPGEVEHLLDRPPPCTEADLAAAAEVRRSVEQAADAAAAGGALLRLRRLAVLFDLDEVDVEILLVVIAPDVDARYEKAYGYLHDDVTRRRASIGLALALAGADTRAAAARQRLRPGGRLIDGGLVEIEPEEERRPFLTRALRAADRVTMHLLGDDRPDPALTDLLAPVPPCLAGDPDALGRAMTGGASLSYLQERSGASGRALAAAAFGRLNLPPIALDTSRLAADTDPVVVARAAVREARLAGAGLVVGPVEALAERSVAALRTLAERSWLTVLTGSRSWDPDWSSVVPLVVEVPPISQAARDALWRACLDDAAAGLDPAEATRTFSLGPEQIGRAVQSASLRALHEGRELEPEDLRAGARNQNVAGLERMAHRVHPEAGWDDIVLPPLPLTVLKELTARLRLRGTVYDEWGMRGTGRRGDGITALFAGASGTGKTMAAEVIAHEVGLDLYAIDLATIVDKYIGETEKNLDKVFGEAERVNGVLFFDEADALFGKRSEVRDAHDRYANVEVAYLLQRMEAFSGMAILATNLRANLDDAFARRLDAIIEFPVPDAAHRERIWERCLSGRVPVADDVDLEFAAGAFELTGGNIRNIALAAAFLAADEGRSIGMADLIHGTQREYRKLGRLCVEADFGRYYPLLSS